MCANTILKLFFNNGFLLLCLTIAFFVFAGHRQVRPSNDFQPKNATVITTKYKPFDLF